MKPKSAAELLGLDPEYVKKLDEERALLESGKWRESLTPFERVQYADILY